MAERENEKVWWYNSPSSFHRQFAILFSLCSSLSVLFRVRTLLFIIENEFVCSRDLRLFCVVDQHSCMLLLRSHIEFHRANALHFSSLARALSLSLSASLFQFDRMHIRVRKKTKRK